MDHNHLTAKEICSIIEKCGKNGVFRILFRDLELEFHLKTENAVKEEPFTEIKYETEQKAVETDRVTPESSPREEFERVLEESKYLDPELYERLSALDENTQNIGA